MLLPEMTKSAVGICTMPPPCHLPLVIHTGPLTYMLVMSAVMFVLISANRIVDLLPCTNAVFVMTYFFVRFAMFAFGVSAQVLDYETTPFPPALTSFTCQGRPPGYYADVETGCKTYHVCDGNSHFTYICPRRTLFQQKSRTCDHSYLVRCQDSSHVLDEEETLRLATISEEGQSTEGKQDEIYNATEESTPTGTTPIASEETAESAETPTTEPLRSSSAEFSTVKGQLSSKEDCSNHSAKNLLKIQLKDLRWLFFIPEIEDNSVVGKSVRELTLPVEKNDLMTFKTRKEVTGLSSLCPARCNPKYFSPGTCHPCLVIK